MIVYDKEQKEIVIPNGIGNINLFNNGVEAGYNQGKTDGVNEQKSKLESINITENGTYSREDGYNEIVVDVPDLNGDYNEGYAQGKIDGINEQKSKLESINITENGTYSREDGYNHIEVNIPDLNLLTYSELKSLRDAGKLVPGTQYRITDYTCTTTQSGTKSAGHQFDVIVTADDESTLNEEARAALHTGDEYFSGCTLNAWQIWYCLDNDTKRFAWADNTNGKGVIYRMIDEFNNDVPYDFKNIQFYRKWDSSKSLWSTISSNNTGVPCYTFSSAGRSSTTDFTDTSLSESNSVYSNTIKEYVDINKQTLSNNCFFGNICCSNSFGNNCYKNTFGNSCYSNSFGNICYSNSFGNICYSNSFGNYCCYNSFFGNICYSNSFGNYCCYNSFGSYCCCNSFGNNCTNIKFAPDSSVSEIYNYYQNNHFGDGCRFIVFTGAETASTLAQVQNYNVAQGLQGTSDADLTIDGKRNLTYETKVAKNSNGELKIYCEADLIL